MLKEECQKLKQDNAGNIQQIDSQKNKIKTLELQNDQLRMEIQQLKYGLEDSNKQLKQKGGDILDAGSEGVGQFFQKYDGTLRNIESFYLDYQNGNTCFAKTKIKLVFLTVIDPLKERLDQYYSDMHKVSSA